jgi:hypothetical protein
MANSMEKVSINKQTVKRRKASGKMAKELSG